MISGSALYVTVGLAALAAATCSADGSANVPLTRWPGAVALVSATLSVALPAVEMTLAEVAVS